MEQQPLPDTHNSRALKTCGQVLWPDNRGCGHDSHFAQGRSVDLRPQLMHPQQHPKNFSEILSSHKDGCAGTLTRRGVVVLGLPLTWIGLLTSFLCC